MKELLTRKEEGKEEKEEPVCLSDRELVNWERRSQKRNWKYMERIRRE